MEKTQKNGRVIVTYGRSIIALMIAQSLGAKDIDIIGCDDVDMTVLSFSQFVSKNCLYTCPDENEEQFIEDLLEIVRDNKPDTACPYVLMPAFRDAKIIAKYKDRFKGIIKVACPDFEAIESVDHKDAFAKTTNKFDVPSPETWLVSNENDLNDISEEIKFPVFIKPPNDVGGRGISKIEDEENLKTAFKELQETYPGDKIIIQTLAEGVDYCFCGLFDHGELVASMVYHNLQKFPEESGAGIVRETVDSQRFDTIAQDLMRPLKWHGVAGIDFMWDEKEDSTPSMIEVNARFWAGLDHSIKSNVDFPWLLYQLVTQGKVINEEEPEIGKKTSLPGLPTIARIESLFSKAINFEQLEKQWPVIKEDFKDKELKAAGEIFKDAMSESFSFDKAFKTFQSMSKDVKDAQKLSYGDDDPFIGLGALFIIGSLIRHGRLPPEIKQ